MRSSHVIFCLFLCTLAAGAVADERGEHLYQREQGGDTFAAGDSPRVSAPVKGDLLAAGGELRLAGPVQGDVIALGGAVHFDGAGGQDLYAAGGTVALEGTIARNARMAGGNVSLGPRARIAGNASLAGGRVEMLGAVGGYLQVAGGRLYLDGRVEGDVEAAGGELELGPNARIGGTLRYRGDAPLAQDPAAQVAGGIERLETRARGEAGRRALPALVGLWTLGLMALAAVLVAALPGFFGRVAQAARARFGWSLLWGFIAFSAVPVAAVVLAVTVVGLPLALLAMLAYFALLKVGYVSAGIALGDGVLARWWSVRAAHRGWRALFAAFGVLAICIVALIPWLGALVAFVALIAGMGALLVAVPQRA